jgi:transcriptional regulator with XRE-family HTH domain
MDVATSLRDARRRAGLTQADLARAGGTSQATISAYENGRKQPSLSTLSRLLGTTGAQLTVEGPGRRAVEPSATEFEQAGRRLADVLRLAAALPARHDPELRYPPLARASG